MVLSPTVAHTNDVYTTWTWNLPGQTVFFSILQHAMKNATQNSIWSLNLGQKWTLLQLLGKTGWKRGRVMKKNAAVNYLFWHVFQCSNKCLL